MLRHKRCFEISSYIRGVAVSIFGKTGTFTLLGIAGLVLSSCVVVDEGPNYRPLPPRPGGPQACTMEFMPVCGERAGRQQIFPNSCNARAQGFRIAHNGECRSSGWRPTPPVVRPSLPSRPTPSQRACTREFAPVCATRGNRMQTFPNACEAANANFRVISRGQCDQLPRRR